MDVKYKQADWEQMNSGLRDLIGLGKWGKGAIDDLKDLSKLMDKVESDLSKFDSDGVISLSHRNQDSKYQELFEDFKVITEFSNDVGKLVNETIDEPFHKDIDSFVEKMRNTSISHFTTDNRIGATDTITSHYAGYRQEHVIEKKEIGLEDLFNGDNFYAEQMKLEYELWQEQVSDEEITYEDYQLAAVSMNAFEYNSIKDSQMTKEFWVSIAATVVIIGATIICPPAGLALGVAYGTLELSSAVSGTDWVSGREIDTGERLLRGGLAPLDIIPGVSAVKRFGTAARTVSMGTDLAQAGTRTALTTRLTSSAQQQMRTVQDVVVTAGKQADARLRSAGQFLKGQGANAVVRVADDLTEIARLGDKGITAMKNAIPQNGFALDGMGTTARIPAENAHTLENATSGLANWMKSSVGSGGSGVNVPVGTGRQLDDVPRIKEIEVNFTRNPKHNQQEFARQLKDQEKGMNQLTVDEYLKNREKYIAEGRAIEGNAAQQTAREEALSDKISELMANGKSFDEAEKVAKKWLNTQAALHNPDQIAGGRPDKIGGMGDKGINSSIGSQWKYRIDVVDGQIRELAKNMTSEQIRNTYLNVKLTN
ncbi:polymorphic toxin type 15 domain-containing protein [Halalkalibacter sp. AB-rgal2]|uniref:polymorphic toxin type 15 domain-containing protein n=1 Tax=Halalkalibacter sp. AB-rgal2 TaxID=3242695 RepID=UPI00359D7B46